MILTCNSCNKKFVVPDNAITASGRTVQCGSCGNKWKQFPLNKIKDTQINTVPQKKASKLDKFQPKIQKPKKAKQQLRSNRKRMRKKQSNGCGKRKNWKKRLFKPT